MQRVRQFETRLADTTTNSLGLKFGMDTQCLPRAQSDRMNPSVVQRRLPVPSGKREVGRRRDCRDSREVKVQQARIKPDNDLSGRTSSSGRTSDSGLCGIILQGMFRTSSTGQPRVASAASLVGVPSAHGLLPINGAPHLDTTESLSQDRHVVLCSSS